MPQTDSARSVQLYRLSLFLQRIFFQLHQPFGSSKHGHESGHQLRKLAGRTLYLVHQLQEGRHAAERQRVERHTDGSPREGDKIAEGEAEVQDEVGEDRELRPAHHPAAELALCPLQPAHDHFVALERLDEHPVLDGLLENALDLRIRVAHFSCQPPHLAHINLADQDKQRYHDDNENRQPPVHRHQIEKRAEEHRQRRDRTRYGLSEEAHHIGDIKLQPVQHIATVVTLLPMPFRAQDTVEHTLLHTVLRLDAQQVPHPYGSNVQGEVAENQSSHDGYRHIDTAVDDMRRHVDGVLDSPYGSQRDTHTEDAYHCVQHRLLTVSAPGDPEPAEDFPGRIVRVRNLQESFYPVHHCFLLVFVFKGGEVCAASGERRKGLPQHPEKGRRNCCPRTDRQPSSPS